jgi:EmrB/QacA subfamily drug resistance transporter
MSQEKALPKKQQNFVLITSILASGMASIDATALNVALPSLQNSLGLSGSELLWVINAYTLFLAALILIGGSLGDIYGKKKVFGIGIALFTVFSIACGFATNGPFLIVARALQGVGGAVMIPGSLSLISASFPQETRGKAIGTWSMLSAVTTIFGPILGGWLAGQGLWRLIFFINAPLAAVCLYLLYFKIDEPVPPNNQKPDWKGATWATLAFTGITFGFIQASEIGFGSWWIWLSIGIGVLSMVMFIYTESKQSEPMMPLWLFKSYTFSGANAMTLFVYGALGALLFFLPLNLIQIQGYPEYLAGMSILPFGIIIALLARISGSWTDRFGAKALLVVGPILTGLGFIGYTLIGQTAGSSDYFITFFPVMVLGGIGMGITVVPLTTIVMNCVSQENAGIASGVNNSVSRFAGVLALAVVGAIGLLQFQNALPTALADKNFTDEDLQFVKQEAQRFADAKPNASWVKSKQKMMTAAVKNSFISVFNLIAYISAGLCFVGAIISGLYISGKPKEVQQKETSV